MLIQNYNLSQLQSSKMERATKSPMKANAHSSQAQKGVSSKTHFSEYVGVAAPVSKSTFRDELDTTNKTDKLLVSQILSTKRVIGRRERAERNCQFRISAQASAQAKEHLHQIVSRE